MWHCQKRWCTHTPTWYNLHSHVWPSFLSQKHRRLSHNWVLPSLALFSTTNACLSTWCAWLQSGVLPTIWHFPTWWFCRCCWTIKSVSWEWSTFPFLQRKCVWQGWTSQWKKFLVPFHKFSYAFYIAEYCVWLINLLTTKSTHLLNHTFIQYSDFKTKLEYYSTQETPWVRHMCSQERVKDHLISKMVCLIISEAKSKPVK